MCVFPGETRGVCVCVCVCMCVCACVCCCVRESTSVIEYHTSVLNTIAPSYLNINKLRDGEEESNAICRVCVSVCVCMCVCVCVCVHKHMCVVCTHIVFF